LKRLTFLSGNHSGPLPQWLDHWSRVRGFTRHCPRRCCVPEGSPPCTTCLWQDKNGCYYKN